MDAVAAVFEVFVSVSATRRVILDRLKKILRKCVNKPNRAHSRAIEHAVKSMLLTVVVIALLTAYYFGLRRAAQAAVVTAGLCLVAFLLPRYASTINWLIAGGAVAVWAIGRKRPRPPDAVLAVAWIRRSLSRVRALLGKK
jgi:chromate transport protein ChrA